MGKGYWDIKYKYTNDHCFWRRRRKKSGVQMQGSSSFVEPRIGTWWVVPSCRKGPRLRLPASPSPISGVRMFGERKCGWALWRALVRPATPPSSRRKVKWWLGDGTSLGSWVMGTRRPATSPLSWLDSRNTTLSRLPLERATRSSSPTRDSSTRLGTTKWDNWDKETKGKMPSLLSRYTTHYSMDTQYSVRVTYIPFFNFAHSSTPISTNSNFLHIFWTPLQIDYKGKPIVKMACGGEFSMILDITGGLFAFGNPEFGQLGKLTSHSQSQVTSLHLNLKCKV